MAISSPQVVRGGQRGNPLLDAMSQAMNLVNQHKALQIEQERLNALKDQTTANREIAAAQQFFEFVRDLAEDMGPAGAQLVTRRFRRSMTNMLSNLGASQADLDAGFDLLESQGFNMSAADLHDAFVSAFVSGDVSFKDAVERAATGVAGREDPGFREPEEQPAVRTRPRPIATTPAEAAPPSPAAAATRPPAPLPPSRTVAPGPPRPLEALPAQTDPSLSPEEQARVEGRDPDAIAGTTVLTPESTVLDNPDVFSGIGIMTGEEPLIPPIRLRSNRLIPERAGP